MLGRRGLGLLLEQHIRRVVFGGGVVKILAASLGALESNEGASLGRLVKAHPSSY